MTVWNKIKNIDFVVSGVCLAGLVLLTVMGVVMRYVHAVVVGTLLFLAYNGLSLAMLHAGVEKTTNILKIPYWFIDSAVPIGCLLMCVNYVVTAVFGTEDEEVISYE